jgi:energy-coupling factor transporter transmembrane protein EcfT
MRNLNPVTKILCIIAINITITFGINVIMEIVLLACMSGLFLANGKWKKCIGYTLIFAFLLFGDKFILPVITLPWLSTLACLVFIAFRKFFFCIMSADFFISTTEINRMIASLEKIKVPQVIIIPLAVLVRFFPTVKEEWIHIRTAMRMRNIGTGAGQILRHPIEAMEYMIVPLLFSTIKIGEELAAAALARGLGMHNQRTNLCHVSLKMADYLVMGCAVAIVVFSKVCGGY